MAFGDADIFGGLKAAYDAADESTKTAVNEAFGDDEVMESRASANMWLNENEDSRGTMQEAYAAIKQIGNN